ncbi:MAG: hypothetical protein MK132_20305 [Lentisphaerales bacterium]|nr:hypothetical protein [Lentisphaerales bacterium]
MTGYFNNITESAMDGNKANVPPIVRLFSEEDEKKFNELNKEIGTVKNKMKAYDLNSQKYKDWLVKMQN